MLTSITKKLLCLSVCFILLLTHAGCTQKADNPSQKSTLPSATKPNERYYTTFSTDHYQITLPKDFRQVKTPDGRTAYSNDHVNVILGYELFTVHPSLPDLPLE